MFGALNRNRRKQLKEEGVSLNATPLSKEELIHIVQKLRQMFIYKGDQYPVKDIMKHTGARNRGQLTMALTHLKEVYGIHVALVANKYRCFMKERKKKKKQKFEDSATETYHRLEIADLIGRIFGWTAVPIIFVIASIYLKTH